MNETTPQSRHVLYPNRYAWFVLFSALDIMLTHRILTDFGLFGGRELNTIADAVISRFGLWGAIGLKLASVIVVVVVCEIVGRKRASVGDSLATGVTILSVLPPAWALFLLARFALFHHEIVGPV